MKTIYRVWIMDLGMEGPEKVCVFETESEERAKRELAGWEDSWYTKEQGDSPDAMDAADILYPEGMYR